MKNLLFVFLCAGILAILMPIFLVSGRIDTPESVVEAAADQMVGDESFFVQDVTSTEVSGDLHEPPIAVLSRVIGEPLVQKGEKSIRLPVLMYHHIRPMQARFSAKDRQFTVTPEHFEAQMRSLIRAGFVFVTPAQLEEALEKGSDILPAKPILITLDDAFRDQYENAFPILRKLNLKATFFIVSQATMLKGNMSETMIKEIDQSGLGTIAAHTQHHVFLARSSIAKRWEEIKGSKDDLEKLLNHPVNYFAYPYGSWSPVVANDVEKAGFQLGFGVRMGSLHTSSSRYELRRIRVLDGENVTALVEKLTQRKK